MNKDNKPIATDREIEKMDVDTYHRLLDTFLPSEEMRAYLKSRPVLPNKTLLSMIVGAPVPLEEKARWAWGEIKHLAEEALSELTLRPGELFALSDAWYDDEIQEAKCWFNAPFLSYDSVIDHIRAELAECEDAPIWQWYVLEKWIPGDNLELTHVYTYWLIGDQIMFFSKKDNEFSPYCIDPNLPVPFRAGDLVTIDCRPFAPLKHALILERGDNHDCCCLQALWRDEKTGLWDIGTVKHSHVFGAYIFPLYTPIYRLSRFNGELPPGEKPLSAVQSAIAYDEQKGSWIWNHFDRYSSKWENSRSDGLTNRELRRLARELKSQDRK